MNNSGYILLISLLLSACVKDLGSQYNNPQIVYVTAHLSSVDSDSVCFQIFLDGDSSAIFNELTVDCYEKRVKTYTFSDTNKLLINAVFSGDSLPKKDNKCSMIFRCKPINSDIVTEVSYEL